MNIKKLLKQKTTWQAIVTALSIVLVLLDGKIDKSVLDMVATLMATLATAYGISQVHEDKVPVSEIIRRYQAGEKEEAIALAVNATLDEVKIVVANRNNTSTGGFKK